MVASPLVKLPPAKKCAGKQPSRVMAISDPCVSQAGKTAIVRRDKRFQVCSDARGFYAAPNVALQISDSLTKLAAILR
jgi:hypothetical protein